MTGRESLTFDWLPASVMFNQLTRAHFDTLILPNPSKMKLSAFGKCLAILGLLLTSPVISASAADRASWIDPDTGHRVIQLSSEPGSESLYFNLNPFTPDGRKMVITTPEGISLIDLQTHAVEKILEGRTHIIMVGHKTGQIYYVSNEIENGATNR